jgi:hypothetical protein
MVWIGYGISMAWRRSAYQRLVTSELRQARIVDLTAGVEHRERTFAKQGVQAALAGIQQFGDFLLGKVLQAAFRGHSSIDHVRR